MIVIVVMIFWTLTWYLSDIKRELGEINRRLRDKESDKHGR